MKPLAVLSVLLIYFLLLILISYITGRKADNDSFFLGNRKSPWYIVAFGMIGASLSGVTFISVPGWVGTSNFSYLQMVFGYLLGYLFVANILLPLYYKLNLTSIYTYLEKRFGVVSYKTGSSFFLLSRVIGASFRLFLVANVLQITVFDKWHIPFVATVLITIVLIWLYTFRGGIRTIIWTDTLQTFFMLLAVGSAVYLISSQMGLNLKGVYTTISESDYSRIFFFDDWNDKRHFVKQFLSGIFITIVMTGLDQDMMQKNLSCKNIKDAKKNMLLFSIVLVPVNLLFLALGALMFVYSQSVVIAPEDLNLIAATSDNLFPVLAAAPNNAVPYLGTFVGIIFIVGLIAAAYSSADSALTALTTSFTVDILGIGGKSEEKTKKTRIIVHIMFSLLLATVILIFKAIEEPTVINAIFTVAGYTYGPLLGMYSFGLFTKLAVKDRFVPIVAVLSPIVCYIININSITLFNGYKFGFELLILNGLITFIGLIIISKRQTWK